MTEPVLSQRQLNRAFLARQLLLERGGGSIEAAMEQVGGLQTQVSRSGYIGLWTRQAGLTRQAYTDALLQRRLIQGTIMRVTIHTVTAADYWPIRSPCGATGSAGTCARGPAIGPSETCGGRRTPPAERWPTGRCRSRSCAPAGGEGHHADATSGFGLWVDLVRVPPPGTWDRPRADLYGLAEAWLPPPKGLTEDGAKDLLLRRYLGAFGPASLADASNWTGFAVADLRPIVERLPLRRFRDERGRTLIDLPDAPLPDAETPAPPRFLPSFDATLLIQARRTQILPEALRPHVFNVRTPQSWNTFLLDGQVAGTWTYRDDRVELDPLRKLSRAERRSLDDELGRAAGVPVRLTRLACPHG